MVGLTILDLTIRAKAIDACITIIDIRIAALNKKTDATFKKSNDGQEDLLRKILEKR